MKWFPLVGGILSILYAFFLFAHPLTSVATIAWIIALVIFVSGISNFLEYINHRDNRSFWQLIQSIFSIVIGFILLISSVFSLAIAFMTIIAYWILFSGILRLLTGLQLRKLRFPSSSLHISSAILTIIFGLVLLGTPLFSASVIGFLVALVFLFVGLILLSIFFSLNVD